MLPSRTESLLRILVALFNTWSNQSIRIIHVGLRLAFAVHAFLLLPTCCLVVVGIQRIFLGSDHFLNLLIFRLKCRTLIWLNSSHFFNFRSDIWFTSCVRWTESVCIWAWILIHLLSLKHPFVHWTSRHRWLLTCTGVLIPPVVYESLIGLLIHVFGVLLRLSLLLFLCQVLASTLMSSSCCRMIIWMYIWMYLCMPLVMLLLLIDQKPEVNCTRLRWFIVWFPVDLTYLLNMRWKMLVLIWYLSIIVISLGAHLAYVFLDVAYTCETIAINLTLFSCYVDLASILSWVLLLTCIPHRSFSGVAASHVSSELHRASHCWTTEAALDVDRISIFSKWIFVLVWLLILSCACDMNRNLINGHRFI